MQFLQSRFDFPQMVTLGDKMPSFGLNRFRQKLRFIPVDDEGFTLRGNKQSLVYKGRQRSHRFTILGDGSFEYDTILKREPDSNVIRLRMEGAEKYDFFRQPDFIKNPFLQGSYAVYKKQTLLGEGTGKLCHIHRPEIIDARGRRCWGALAVIGNELRITIPEQWLSEAAYPVVVDPTVGTTTVGALTTVPHPSYQEYTVFFSKEIGVEQFPLQDNLQGQATAFFYSDGINISNVTPVLYSSCFELPDMKLSSNEGKIVSKYPYELNMGWQSAVFNVNYIIFKGNIIWFGLYADSFFPRCDYGGSLITVSSSNKVIFEEFPTNQINNNNVRHGLKLSMYFTYEAVGDNYYSFVFEAVEPNDNLLKTKIIFKEFIENVRVNMTLNASRIIAKICHVIDSVRTDARIFTNKILLIKITELLKTEGTVIRELFISLRIKTNSFIRSIFNKRFLNSRVEISLKSRIGGSNRNEE